MAVHAGLLATCTAIKKFIGFEEGGGVNNRRARSIMTLEYSFRRKLQLSAFVPLAACLIREATAFGCDT
jgi:hypothetical protein